MKLKTAVAMMSVGSYANFKLLQSMNNQGIEYWKKQSCQAMVKPQAGLAKPYATPKVMVPNQNAASGPKPK